MTVHGRDEVVAIAAEESRRLKGNQTGAAVVEASFLLRRARPTVPTRSVVFAVLFGEADDPPER